MSYISIKLLRSVFIYRVLFESQYGDKASPQIRSHTSIIFSYSCCFTGLYHLLFLGLNFNLAISLALTIQRLPFARKSGHRYPIGTLYPELFCFLYCSPHSMDTGVLCVSIHKLIDVLQEYMLVYGLEHIYPTYPTPFANRNIFPNLCKSH